MFGLKGKTLFFFIITTVLLMGLGVYFFITLNALMKQVELSFEPKQQNNLLKNLTIDINTLNNQYLNDTLELSGTYIDSIIGNVEKNIDKIQAESKKLDFKHSNNLDTIPEILRELKQKNFELMKLRSAGESEFIYSLEKVIKDEFKDKLLSEKDSIIVTHQITSYIKENKIFEEESEALKEEEKQEEERNFFQRLFNTKDKEKQSEEKEVQEEELEEKRKEKIVELDTVTQQQIDTVNQMGGEQTTMNLINVFEQIQSKRIQYMNNIQTVEKEIYELNYDINKKIEDIINDFILQQYASYENYLAELKAETNQQTNVLLFTIFGFILFSIILVFRFFKDIRRNEEYQQTLKIKEKQAKKETAEKQRFLNTMSHEIRTPLTSIVGYVDLLEGEDKNIKAIKSSANYLYQMTNEILDIAKINLGVIEIEKETVDLTKKLQEIKDNFIPQLENKALDYEFEIPEKPLWVHTDGQRVQQILYNLIHNAIKFTEKGAINLKVDVKDLNSHYQLVFRVIDSGIGMSQEEQSQIFEDFHQAGTHKSKMKGTGLGLGIVQELVHLLAGEIHLNSAPGKGTTFVVSFKFEKSNEEEFKALNASSENQDVYHNSWREKSILIVDDDVLITELYQKIIAPTGAQTTVFNQPKEALTAAIENTFDLLIIDYKMPEMSGFDFLKSLQKQKRNLPKTIISTANAMLDEVDKEKLTAFDKVIFKPIKKDQFLYEVAEVLEVSLYNVKKALQEPQSSELQNEETKEGLTLESLKNYVGNEPQELVEVLTVIVNENEKSLALLSKAIKEKDKEEIAFVVHQLSSRFAQTDAKLEINTQDIEQELKSENMEFNKDKLKELLNFWKEGQAKIEHKLKTIQQSV